MWKKEKSETTASDLTNKIIPGIHIKESESENINKDVFNTYPEPLG